MKFKTLKDIEKENNMIVWQLRPQDFINQIKAEAVKWVEHLTEYKNFPENQKEIRFQQAKILEQFFNIDSQQDNISKNGYVSQPADILTEEEIKGENK